MSGATSLERYFAAASRSGLYPNARNLRRHLRFLFGDLSFEGARVLDVGAGAGLLGVYACCRGATAVCLEPEAAGSSAGMQASFERLARESGVGERATLLPLTLQQYDFAHAPFDVVVMHNSINHLDEPACMRLHEDESARRTYLGILRTLADAVRPGGALVAADASRRNAFGDLGLTNPFARPIEWTKHQTPALWASLLTQVGFERPVVRWLSYNSLGAPGRLVLGNAVASYFLTSHFCLTMTKACASG